MRLPLVEFLIRHAYGRAMPWATKVQRLPGGGVWPPWIIGEHVPADDRAFDRIDDAPASM